MTRETRIALAAVARSRSFPFGPSDTIQPLGEADATIQITVLRGDSDHGLLTIRGGKDHDLTAEQFDALAVACAKAARRLRSKATRASDRV